MKWSQDLRDLQYYQRLFAQVPHFITPMLNPEIDHEGLKGLVILAQLCVDDTGHQNAPGVVRAPWRPPGALLAVPSVRGVTSTGRPSPVRSATSCWTSLPSVARDSGFARADQRREEARARCAAMARGHTPGLWRLGSPHDRSPSQPAAVRLRHRRVSPSTLLGA